MKTGKCFSKDSDATRNRDKFFAGEGFKTAVPQAYVNSNMPKIPTCQSEVDRPLEHQVNRSIVSPNIPRTFVIHSMVDSMNDTASNISSDNNW